VRARIGKVRDDFHRSAVAGRQVQGEPPVAAPFRKRRRAQAHDVLDDVQRAVEARRQVPQRQSFRRPLCEKVGRARFRKVREYVERRAVGGGKVQREPVPALNWIGRHRLVVSSRSHPAVAQSLFQGRGVRLRPTLDGVERRFHVARRDLDREPPVVVSLL
jgi:hypothetical protein